MNPIVIARVVAATFVALGLMHVYWALGGRLGAGAAVPTISSTAADGQPRVFAAFKPTRTATLGVAAALVFVAVLVGLRAGLTGSAVQHWTIRWIILIVAAILFARAIGDLRLVGFFKTVTATEFAQLNTWLYSPLCMMLALGLVFVVWRR